MEKIVCDFKIKFHYRKCEFIYLGIPIDQINLISNFYL